MATSISKEEFIERARGVHAAFFDYSRIEFINTSTKIEIVCPQHGSFWQSPRRHYLGDGCSKCSGKHTPTSEEFIDRCWSMYGDLYDYSKLKYTSKKIKVEIVCSKHGSFWQLPGNFIQGYGCPLCARRLNLHRSESVGQHLSECEELHRGKYENLHEWDKQ